MLLASPATIREKIDEHYRPQNVMTKLLDSMETDTEVTTVEEQDNSEELLLSAAEASQRPVVRLVDLILSEGILSRASDIHIEPEEGGVAVRYRIDGVLRQVMKVPRAAGLPLISRLKIISNLDIADRLRPQDGRSRVAVNGVPVDLRVSTLPASLGEKVVVRILDSRRNVLTLEALGLSDSEREPIEALLENRDGVILVTGPTGSGKTTTLYSALARVQSDGVNIVTVEDRASCRCRCTNGPDSPLRSRSGPFSARTPTSYWSARFATRKRPRSRSRRPSPGTSCSRPCIRTTRPTRSPA